MGAKPSKENKDLSSRTDLALLPDGTTLTDSVSIGRSGREWHLPIEAKLNRQNASTRCSAAQVTTYYGADTIVRLTCEFLGKHAPETYTKLYAELQNLFPTHSEFPEACRAARDGIRPFKQPDHFDQTLQTHEQRSSYKASFSIVVPEIGPDHWAYKRHATVGNYCTDKSGPRGELVSAEVQQDVASIKHYLTCYKALAEEVRGKTLWKATRHAAQRDPYFTCMEICIGELQTPSHFLSLVHYGMGLHMMYESSMAWKRRDFPKRVPQELISALKESFKTLAKLYREDFCP